MPEATDAFADIEYVVADDKRFIAKLGAGAGVYSSLTVARGIGDAASVSAAAAAGAGIASSSAVATTFFASSGWLAAIGLGSVAVTPIGWVLAAAVASGGAYYGVLRAFRAYENDLVDTVPRWINTPIDLLGSAIVDMLGGIALCVAQADGEICDAEREHIVSYFANEWGIERAYAEAALMLLEQNLDEADLQERVTSFTAYAQENRDCNLDALTERVETLLRALIMSDGRIDPAEEEALRSVLQLMERVGPRYAVALPDPRKTWLGRTVAALSVKGQTA
jgi:tellurite resistance protein